jgi:hypothetical protein
MELLTDELKHNYFCNIKFGRLIGRNQFMERKSMSNLLKGIAFKRIKNWINSIV